MPIHLPVPQHSPNGPDGRGWNRFSLGSLAGDQCALQPQDYSHLVESRDTRRAGYGGYGSCTRGGKCESCPIFQAKPTRMEAFTDRVLIRMHPNDTRVHLMNHPENGWSSSSRRYTWFELSRIENWEIGRRYQDEHSEGFWLTRITDSSGDDA